MPDTSSGIKRPERRPKSSEIQLVMSNSKKNDGGEYDSDSKLRRFLLSLWRGTRNAFSNPKKEAQANIRNYSEFDDMENPIYRRPKSLDHLVAVTHFSRTELKKLYRDFKAECPTGLIKEETFRTMYTQFFPKGANGSQYSHYVFNSLASDRSGLLGFEELVLALSDLCRGPADKKLRWAFHIYDHDGDGVISRNELEDVALSINELTGDNAASGGDPLVANATARIWVDRIFQKMDLNEDGVITQDEFLAVCLRDEEIHRSLTMFDNVF